MWFRKQAKAVPIASSPPAPTPTQADRNGIDFGWRVHDAVQHWTATVDSKASIVVIVETAVAGAATKALITGDGELHTAVGWHLAFVITAVVFLVLAVASALWVVFPRLERLQTQRLAADGLIYFGHLRAHSTEAIVEALSELTAEQERRQLASQLRITGDVAWRKHSWLQRSLVFFALGAALLVIAYTAF
jgi:ABC-type uncharacterized transport system fused permease/ATPase subunit